MKNFIVIVFSIVFVSVFTTLVFASIDKGGTCIDLKSEKIVDINGNIIPFGRDRFGYNYQANSFIGTYDGEDRKIDGMNWEDPNSTELADDLLNIKWSNDWLANVDCNGDGYLDSGLVNGISDGISKGWLTKTVKGDYTDENGVVQQFTYYVKYVYVETVTNAEGNLEGVYKIAEEQYTGKRPHILQLESKKGVPGLGKKKGWGLL
jgi:hypothetical protein